LEIDYPKQNRRSSTAIERSIGFTKDKLKEFNKFIEELRKKMRTRKSIKEKEKYRQSILGSRSRGGAKPNAWKQVSENEFYKSIQPLSPTKNKTKKNLQ
jgi:hypothetical protein